MEDVIVLDRVVQELKSLIKENELSLASRLMLDFLTDANLPSELLNKAIIIRAAYNKIEVSTPGNQKKELKQQMMALMESIEKNISPEGTKKATGMPAVKSQSQMRGAAGKVVFRAEKVRKSYKNMAFELASIDLELKVGELTGVVGENGQGKTTLLRIVAGDLAVSDGLVTYPALFNARNWYEIKQQIAFIPQRIPRWHGLLKENLHFSAANHEIYGRENEEMVDYIIHRLGLTRYKNARWQDISSGFKLRFELAKALVWKPKLLVLDEPLANLDVNTKLLFMQDLRMLSNIRRHPIAIILSSQQLHEIESVVDNIVFLKNGRPAYNGSMKNLGDDWVNNTFEVAGNFSRTELLELLQKYPNTSVEDTGQSLLIHTPKDLDGNELLSHLVSFKKINYFRDISKSTRKLFAK